MVQSDLEPTFWLVGRKAKELTDLQNDTKNNVIGLYLSFTYKKQNRRRF